MATFRLGMLSILCVFILYLPCGYEAKVVQGTITPTLVNGEFVKWQFIARFCFQSDTSHAEFQFFYPDRYYMQELLLYYDDPQQWPAVYPPGDLNCSARLNPLRGQNQILTLSYGGNMTAYNRLLDEYPWMQAWGYWDKCDRDINNGIISCKFDLSFRSMRDRWWYMVIANCDAPQGIYIEYNINLTNGPESDIFFYQFSADEFYILQVDLGFLAIQVIVLVVTCVTAHFLSKLDFFHSTMKLFLVSVVLEVAHLVVACWTNGVYAHTGLENRFSKYLGLALQAASYIIFIIMLILMAKGFTITRGRLKSMTVIKMTIFIVCYIILYIVMFIWEMLVFDEGLVTYRYGSAPGYCLVAMRVVAWVWFFYATGFTLKNYPEKNKFYVPFVIFYTIWFLTGPLVVLIAVYAMPAWNRAKSVNATENVVTLFGQVFFLIVTRPSSANTNFPFRIRTWQIAAMDGEATPPADGEAPAYGVAAKYATNTSGVDMFTASNFRPIRRLVGDIDKFPHHQPDDMSHFTVAAQPNGR